MVVGNAKARSELSIRIISAIVLIFFALVTAWIGSFLFTAFWAAAAIAVFWEWVRMASVRAYIPCVLQIGVGALALILLAAIPIMDAESEVIAIAGVALLATVSVACGRTNQDRLWTLFGFFYATVIAYFPSFLRELPQNGLTNILWVFAVVWATDIAAYFTGRTFGGPKLWQRVSPNKTWSGFFGGLLAGMGAGVIIVVFLQGGQAHFSWFFVALFSAIASILSQGGDLAESALKRHFGIKDSSSLIPGHGGAMDRLDGFWAAVFFLGMCLFLERAFFGSVV